VKAAKQQGLYKYDISSGNGWVTLHEQEQKVSNSPRDPVTSGPLQSCVYLKSGHRLQSDETAVLVRDAGYKERRVGTTNANYTSTISIRIMDSIRQA